MSSGKWSWHRSAAQAVAPCTWLESQSSCRESRTVRCCIGVLFSPWGGCLVWVLISFLSPSRKAQLEASYICSAPFSICVQNLFLLCSQLSSKWPHLPRPGFVHKGNLDLRQPGWGVPLLPPWAGIATAIPGSGQSPGPPREDALCGFAFSRSGEDTVKCV